VPTQGKPSAPIHSLADVKLEELKKPYIEKDIKAYLEKHQVGRMDDTTFDDCLFQSVLFTDFFEKIEAGKIERGRPEDDLPVEYLLKKSIELLKPLGEKIHAARQRYNKMLENSPPDLHAKLVKELAFVEGMVARFETLESDLLDAWAEPLTFSPTRDKACFLLFAHAILADAANEAQRWMTDLAAAKPEEMVAPLLSLITGDEGRMISNYVTRNEVRSNLFSAEPMTPADQKLYAKGLSNLFEADDVMKKITVPSFSPTGSQGVLALLHGIFHGKGLLTGAAGQPYPVHANGFNGSHLATLRHDCAHVQVMKVSQVFSSIAPKLMPIYRKLENSARNLPTDAVKKDLLVLFHILHEDPETLMLLNFPDSTKSFLDCARVLLNRELTVVDTVALLKKVDVSIPAVDKNSSPKDKADRYEAVAQAMNGLWKDFRQRHAEDLKASGLLAKLPKFLKD
jgi:hypothetical protein